MGLAAFNRMRRLRAEQAQAALNEQTQATERELSSYTQQEITDMNAKEQRAFIEQYNLQVDGYKRLTAPELEEKLLEALNLSAGEGNE